MPVHWMAEAFKNAGKPGHSLHAATHTPAGERIPATKVKGALHSSNTHTQRMAQAAANANPGMTRERKPYE
jgi:hypothetical protein